ncbi:TfpX/TfpZ family type IV pilin accessory protein [Acinetobacter indicus]|uniref:TfpX/TfpZ family type IV pilin accessory protein n=1 Tax=Acinetobacter indicus TaxID=756892 RepID=UPI0035BBA737
MSKRLNFFLSHLGISILIALAVVGLIFFVWYPQPLATAVGVTQIFLMLLTIDIIIGPLLGLLVYKEGKKSLKFDLSVIILLQISALFYGLYNLEQGRPAWLVYNVDRFDLVRKNDIFSENIEQAVEKYQKPAWFDVQYVAITFSKDPEQRSDDFFTEAFGGISIAQRPERYIELSEVKEQIHKRALNLDQLKQFNAGPNVEAILNKYPKANAWLPLKANAVDMVVLIHKETAEVIKIVDLRPWY